MKKVVMIILVILFLLMTVAISGIIYFKSSLPSREDYTHLIEPRIVFKDDVKSVKVRFNGDPDMVVKEAFKKLYKIYYGIKDVPKMKGQPAPVARYEDFDELFKNFNQKKLKEMDWKGFVEIPVPGNIMMLPEEAGLSPYPAELENLEYGMVGEIVHFGPYEEESTAIGKLFKHISDKGYKISGLHEEEYIIGPGMPFSKPGNYITIIRYQVSEK